ARVEATELGECLSRDGIVVIVDGELPIGFTAIRIGRIRGEYRIGAIGWKRSGVGTSDDRRQIAVDDVVAIVQHREDRRVVRIRGWVVDYGVGVARFQKTVLIDWIAGLIGLDDFRSEGSRPGLPEGPQLVRLAVRGEGLLRATSRRQGNTRGELPGMISG